MRKYWIVLAMLACAASVTFAHHAPSAIFDMGKRTTITGKLSKVNWVNPHIVVNVDATDGKKGSWTLESNPPAWFRRVGVNRAEFAKFLGQSVVIECVPARDGSAYGYMQKITFPDKTTLELIVAEPGK